MERTVLTTGAGTGIGLAAVIELARRGFQSVGGVRSHAKARSVSRAARAAGVTVHTVMLDVTDADQCESVMNELKPYGLINNAGVPASGAIEDVSDQDAREALETMVLGPMRLARLAIPHMRAQGGGRIVNISSIYGLMTTPLTGWYQASKHALEALSDALRVELAADGIFVVLIEPGAFRSNIWDTASNDVQRKVDSEYFAAYRRLEEGIKASQRLMGDPIEVARLIASVMSSKTPKARYLIGYDARAIDIYSKVLPTGVRDRLARITLGL
ncbi:MAG TPA: SDR family oxidoreductase [Candidatus Dormibacteraeota bacterium]|nr:SDR family oxidoreductase [Candidatus Dormibacteraeota bacterium]